MHNQNPQYIILLENKIFFLKTLILTIVFYSVVYAFLILNNIFPSAIWIGYLNIFIIILDSVIFFLLNKKKNLFNFFLVTIISTSLLLFVSSLIVETEDQFRSIWFYFIVFISFFIGNQKIGWFFTIISIFILFIYYFSPINTLTTPTYTTSVLGLFIMIQLSFYFSKQQEKSAKQILTYQLELEKLNNSLEKEVKKKVTENTELNRVLVEKSKKAQMGDVISIIAHQWKQPLSIINSNITNLEVKKLLGKEISDKDMQKIIKNIKRQVEFASNTIDDFRHFFNPNKEKKLVDLNKPISMSIILTKEILQNNSVNLYQNITLANKIYTYDNELIQVLLNLIKNANEQFSKESKNRKIEIIGYDDSKYAYIKIKDNAGGIPNHILSKIFDKYFTTKNETDGTGLGLDLCKRIIEDNCNGELTAYNEDNGAVFSIKLSSK